MDPPTTEISTLSLHDALPISPEDPHWGKAISLFSVWKDLYCNGSSQGTPEDPHWGKAISLFSVWKDLYCNVSTQDTSFCRPCLAHLRSIRGVNGAHTHGAPAHNPLRTLLA